MAKESDYLSRVPVNSFYQDENLFPGSVCSGLAMDYGISQEFLQTLHVYKRVQRERKRKIEGN